MKNWFAKYWGGLLVIVACCVLVFGLRQAGISEREQGAAEDVQRAADRKAAWEAPCRPIVFDLDAWATSAEVQCPNKGHTLIPKRRIVLCECPK